MSNDDKKVILLYSTKVRSPQSLIYWLGVVVATITKIQKTSQDVAFINIYMIDKLSNCDEYEGLRASQGIQHHLKSCQVESHMGSLYMSKDCQAPISQPTRATLQLPEEIVCRKIPLNRDSKYLFFAQCRRATTSPPICPGVPPLCHPCACGTPALYLWPPLFAPAEARHWRARGLSLTFTQQSLFAITMLPILKPIPIGQQKLNYLYFLHVDS